MSFHCIINFSNLQRQLNSVTNASNRETLLTDLCKLPNNKAQYLAISSEFLSRPVDAERSRAPVRPRITVDLLDGIISGTRGELGGFFEIFPVLHKTINLICLGFQFQFTINNSVVY